MKIEKNINGYTIEVNFDEYSTLKEALKNGESYIHEKFGVDGSVTGYSRLYQEMEDVQTRYLTKEESAPIVNCMVCKNCLPPFFRENGKMCKLKECKFEQA